MLQILNLGAGVQSSTVLAMAIKGDLPKLDHAIFADTGYEPARVYNWLKFLFSKGSEAGIQMHKCAKHGENIKENILHAAADPSKRFINIPMFTVHNNKRGILKRQCTKEYKILPIDQYIKYDILKMVPH